jgi:hypothetical protein
VIAVKRVIVGLIVVFAAVAFGVSSASAVEPVEIAVEPGGQHIEDGTPIHAAGQSNTLYIAHVPGVGEVAGFTCDDEFGGYINEDGSGEFDAVTMVGPSCPRQACEVDGVQEPWPFQVEEDHTTGMEMLHWTRCLEPIWGGEHEVCELELPVVHDPEESHHYTVVSDGGDCVTHAAGVTVEVHGAWEFEGREFEIVHPED